MCVEQSYTYEMTLLISTQVNNYKRCILSPATWGDDMHKIIL